ncbi:hypothetical protein OYC64_010395 [Pagothenia borchgrevinki]|uniref:C-type lectin domain-containing protein n=1 Tax=Pagothenia borchgrevinki TaxID=8213 RepID=A0ABD2GW36_PAGBO
MEQSALRLLILASLFKLDLCGWKYVDVRMTWSEATQYCKNHYIYPSSICNQVQHDQLMAKHQTYMRKDVWIVSYQDVDGTCTKSVNSYAVRVRTSCVVLTEEGWLKPNCNQKYPFYCYNEEPVLVKENKTWEEAMEHCRYQYTDLVSLNTGDDLVQILQTSTEAQTNHVWTGMRYLAGSWLWVNGDNMTSQAWGQEGPPQCPVWTHHCGALAREEQHLDSWDCAAKLNFVCF